MLPKITRAQLAPGLVASLHLWQDRLCLVERFFFSIVNLCCAHERSIISAGDSTPPSLKPANISFFKIQFYLAEHLFDESFLADIIWPTFIWPLQFSAEIHLYIDLI